MTELLTKKSRYLRFLKKYTVIFIGVIIIFICYFFDYYSILLTYGIWLSVLILYQLKRSKVLQLIFLFMFSYLYHLIPYFYFNIDIAYYKAYQTNELFEFTLMLHILFTMLIYIFINKNINYKKLSIIDNVVIRNNPLIFLINTLIMLFIIVSGKTGQSIFAANGYNNNTVELAGGLAINEYFLIFVYNAFLFSGGLKRNKIIIIIISVFYIAKNLLYGGRIEMIQLLILLLILFYEKNISNKVFWPAILLGYLFINAFSSFRNSLTLEGMFNSLRVGQDGSKYFSSNQGDVFYNSAVYIGLIKEQIFADSFRIQSFIGFLERIVIPTKFTSPEANLSIYSKEFADAGGGGLISIYFFVWLSYTGILLIALFLSKIFNHIYVTNNQLVLSYILMVLCTVPRWFAYDPITLFKMSGYSVAVYIFFQLIDNLFYKKDKLLISHHIKTF